MALRKRLTRILKQLANLIFLVAKTKVARLQISVVVHIPVLEEALRVTKVK
jgi:hypothetical protein